jgi:hypothetical protein
VLTWLALALAVGFVLAETVALRDAGRRLRAQEAAERAARADRDGGSGGTARQGDGR